MRSKYRGYLHKVRSNCPCCLSDTHVFIQDIDSGEHSDKFLFEPSLCNMCIDFENLILKIIDRCKLGINVNLFKPKKIILAKKDFTEVFSILAKKDFDKNAENPGLIINPYNKKESRSICTVKCKTSFCENIVSPKLLYQHLLLLYQHLLQDFSKEMINSDVLCIIMSYMIKGFNRRNCSVNPLLLYCKSCRKEHHKKKLEEEKVHEHTPLSPMKEMPIDSPELKDECERRMEQKCAIQEEEDAKKLELIKKIMETLNANPGAEPGDLLGLFENVKFVSK